MGLDKAQYPEAVATMREAADEAGLLRQKQALREQLEASSLDLPDF